MPMFSHRKFLPSIKKNHNYLKGNKVSHKACPKPSQILICVLGSISGHTRKNLSKGDCHKSAFL